MLKQVPPAPWNLMSSANGAPSTSDKASTSSRRGQVREEGFEGIFGSDEESVTYSEDEPYKMINKVMSDCFIESTLHTGPRETSQGASSSSNATRSVDFRENPAASHALKVKDISSCEWRAELVVLSACQTARGRILTTEGVLSIARAFMIAGVPCVVASQWKVDDEPTAALMQVLYELELHKGKDVASALRSAMLRRMHTHRHAVNQWAPFNVWGVHSLRIPHDLPLKQKASQHTAG